MLSKLLQKYICECLSRIFIDGSDVKEETFHEALAWHAHCFEEDEVDPSIAPTDVKQALPPRSDATALDRVGAVTSSLQECIYVCMYGRYI